MKALPLAWVCTMALACGACSPDAQAPASTASSASVADRPAGVATAAGAEVPDAAPVYLFDLVQRPGFAEALQALPGAEALPDWVRKGGTATPAQVVQVEGKAMLLATACRPHDCPSERVALLYDERDHAMWGLFAQRPGDVPATADLADDSHDRLRWLGAPDAQRKALLHEALYAR